MYTVCNKIVSQDKKFEMDTKLNVMMWNLVAVVALVLVYGPYVMGIPNTPLSASQTQQVTIKEKCEENWGKILQSGTVDNQKD